MSEEDFNHCFRCRGMKVVDPAVLENLPSLLYRAANLIDTRDDDSPEIALAVIESLKDYAILIESLPDD